jgi:hypothetical protein
MTDLKKEGYSSMKCHRWTDSGLVSDNTDCDQDDSDIDSISRLVDKGLQVTGIKAS